jgi:hypothetical protein
MTRFAPFPTLALAHLEVSAGAEWKLEGAWPTVAVFRLKELATEADVALNAAYHFEKVRRTDASRLHHHSDAGGD